MLCNSTGATIAGDTGSGAAEISVAEARVTAAVSVFEFSTSVLATHDTPDGIVTVHFVEADSVAVAAVSRILESAAAEVP